MRFISVLLGTYFLIPGLPAVAVAPVAGASMPDAVATLAILRAQDEALLRVGEQLVVGGKALCADSGRSAGFTLQYRQQYGADYRSAAVGALGVGDLPTVTAVAAGSAADAAGLRVGDQIERADGHTFRTSPPRRSGGDYAPTAAALDVLDVAFADGVAQLTVRRGAERVELSLAPRPACHARFDVRAGRSSNATSDGALIQVSSDLVAEARGDAELAAILAHELAHNILRHPQRLKARERGLSVKSTEIEADRLSVWLLTAAGFGSDGATSFWSRWGRANDLGILSDGSHPGWRKRVATVAAETAQVAALQGAGQPLLPPPDLRPR